jgi:valyl-tRNA synthetase
LAGGSETTRARLDRHEEIIKRMARLEWTRVSDDIPDGSVQIVLDDATVALPLADVIDFAQEAKRLETEIGKLAKDIGKIDAKLANEQFISKAPAEVIAEQKTRRADAQERTNRLAKALANLSSVG